MDIIENPPPPPNKADPLEFPVVKLRDHVHATCYRKIQCADVSDILILTCLSDIKRRETASVLIVKVEFGGVFFLDRRCK